MGFREPRNNFWCHPEKVNLSIDYDIKSFFFRKWNRHKVIYYLNSLQSVVCYNETTSWPKYKAHLHNRSF